MMTLVVCLVVSNIYGQKQAPGVSSKTLKYHKVLAKRPNSGYLYDRFYGSWLEGGTAESLRKFLQEKAQATAATMGDHLLLAFFYAKQGEDSKALKVFEKALLQDGLSAQAWLEKAKIEARILKFDDALADLNTALTVAPKMELEVRINKLKGRLLAKMGNNEQALKVWQTLIAEHPDDVELREDVIELLSDEGLYVEAIEVAKELSEITRDSYQKIQRKLLTGDLQQRAGLAEEALATYGESLIQTGHGTWIEREILSQIDRMFRRKDDIDGLLAYFSDLVKKEGKRMALRQRQAGLLGELGDEKSAIAAWKTILKLTPGDLLVREAYIAALVQMKRHEQAVEQMQLLLGIFPNDPEGQLRLAQLQWAAEDAQGAGQSIARYLQQSERGEYVYLRAARWLQAFSLEQEALSIYKKILLEFPESIAAREVYAGFLFETKDKEQALLIWKKLAAEGDAAQAVRIARTLSARGQFSSAYQVLRARYDDLKGDDFYLAQLIDAALRAKATEEVFPWVRRRVQLASSGSELVDATEQALQWLRRSDDVKQRVQEMQKNEQTLSAQELCLLAELHNHLGDFEAARELLLRVQGAGRVFALAQLARLHYMRKDWASAAEIVRRQIKLPGGLKISNIKQLVDLYQRSGDLKNTLQWIGEWKKLSPASAAPWMRQAQTLLESGAVEESLKILRLATRRFEDNKALSVKLAETLVEMGKTSDAMQIYWRLYDEAQDALRKMPWVGRLGRIAAESGGTALLIASFDERKRQNRQSIVPLLAMAEIYRLGDRDEERRQVLLEAARLKPKDVVLLHQLASIDEQDGRIEDARQSLRAAMEFDQSGRTHKRLARLYFLTADYEKGFEVMQQAQTRKGSGKDAIAEPELLEEVYNSIIQAGEWERAADFLKRFLVDRPQDYRLQYLYAVALEEGEQYQMAMEAFVNLLSYKEELPARNNADASVKTQPAVNRQHAAMKKERKDADNKLLGFPEEALHLLAEASYDDLAYHYRKNSGEGRIYGFSNQNDGRSWDRHKNSMHVVPPVKVEQAKFYALTHLRKINRNIGKKGKEEIKAAFKGYGIHPRLLEWQKRVEVAESAGVKDRGEIFSAWLKEDPENEVLHALGLRSWQGIRLSFDQREATVNFFIDRNPALGFYSALRFPQNYWVNDKEKERTRAVLNRGIVVAKKIEEIPLSVFQEAAINADKYWGYIQDGERLVTADQRAKLQALAMKWQPDILARTTDVWGIPVSASMLRLLDGGDDIRPLLRALEKEMQDFHKDKNPIMLERIKQQAQSKLEALQRDMSFDALSIPPQGMYDLSQVAINFFPREPQQSTTYERGADWANEQQLAQIKAWVPGVKDPILRALAAQFVGDRDLVKRTIEVLINSDPPSASALMVASALVLKGKQDSVNIKLAAELLVEARQISSEPVRLRVIDGALIDLGLRAEKGSLLQKNAQATIKRVLTSTKIKRSDQMWALAETLGKLGLDKEASRMSQAATKIRYAGRVTTTTLGQAMKPSALSAKIGQLVKQGKRAAAIRTATKQLKPIAAGILGEEASYDAYDLKQLRRVINEAALAAEILKKTKLDKDASLIERVQFGALCEILGFEDRAIKIYQAILQERPDDDNLRVRLVQLLVTTDREATLHHLAKIKNQNSLKALSESLRRSMYHVATDDERFVRAEQALLILQNIKESRAELGGAWEGVRGSLARASYNSARPVLPALNERWDFQTMRKRKGFDEKKFKAALKRRRQLHDQFCQAMLKLKQPGVAPIAFAWLNVTCAAEGADRKEISAQARQVLAQMEVFTFVGNIYSIGPISWGRAAGRDVRHRLPLRGPIEWLVNEAWENGDRNMIYQDILPEIEKSSEREQLAKGFRAYADLYFCEPGEFGNSIAGIGKALNRRGGVQEAINPISVAYRARGLNFDLMPLIKQLIEDADGNGYRFADDLTLLLTLGSKNVRQQRIEKVLGILADLWLGAEADRKDLLRKHFLADSSGAGLRNEKVEMMEYVLDRLGNYPETIFAALYFMQKQGMGASNSVYSMLNLIQKKGYFAKDSQKGVALLKFSPFLDSLEDMRVMPMKSYVQLSGINSATLLGNIWTQLQRLNQQDRQRYQQWLQSLPQPRTMGVQLLLAAWQDKHSLAALKIFAKHEERIRALPHQQQLKMALLAMDVIKTKDLLEVKDEKVKAIWQWLQSKASEVTGDEVLEYLAAKKLSDLGIKYYDLEEFSKKLIGKIVRKDIDQAVQVFEKTLFLLEDSRATGTWSQSYYRGETFSQILMMKIVRSLPAEKALEFESKILQIKNLPEVTPTVWSTSAELARALNKEWNPSDNDLARDRLSGIFARIGGGMNEEGPMVLAGPVFFHLLAKRSENIIEEVIKWSRLPVTSSLYPKLAKEVEMAARLQWVMKRSEKQQPGKEGEVENQIPQEVTDYYLPMLQDETLSRSVRLFILAYLFEGSLVPMPGDAMLTTSIEILTESLNGDTPVLDGVLRKALQYWWQRQEIPDWKERSKSLAAAFQVRFFSGRAPARLRGRPGATAVLLMARLQFAVGNTGQAHQLLSKAESSFSDFTQVLLLLIGEREYAAAGRLLRKRADQLGGSYGNQVWNESLSTHTTAFLDLIEQPSYKLLVRTLLAKMPDPNNNAARQQRLQVVAQEFATLKIENQRLKEQVLYWLSQNPASSQVIKKIIRDEAAKVNIATLFESGNARERRRKMALIKAEQSNLLRQGETQPYIALIEQLTSLSSRNGYYRDRFIKELAHLPNQIAAQQKYNGEVVKKLMPVWDAIFSKIKFNSNTSFAKQHMGHMVFTYTQSAQLALLFEWSDTLTDEDQKKKVAEYLAGCGVTLTSDASKFLKKQPERIEFLKKLTSAPGWMNGNYGVSYSFFRLMVQNKLIPRDMMLEVGPALAEKTPRLGYAWMELAEMLQQEGKAESALAYWDRSIAAAKLGEKTHTRKAGIAGASFQVKKAKALLSLGRTDEAKRVLAKIKSNNIINYNRKAYETLSETLSK
ncbi:MAG: tetratricopeptide repeat protein [Verrucomicrobiales bacterium]|nr:tetratricopeptide repeat protein [Verrucomicrobiales bacterium]